MTQKKIEKCYK